MSNQAIFTSTHECDVLLDSSEEPSRVLQSDNNIVTDMEAELFAEVAWVDPILNTSTGGGNLSSQNAQTITNDETKIENKIVHTSADFGNLQDLQDLDNILGNDLRMSKVYDSRTSHSTSLDNGGIFSEGIDGNDMKKADAVDNIEVAKPISQSTSLLGELQPHRSSDTIYVLLVLQDTLSTATASTDLGQELPGAQTLKDKRYRVKMTSEYAHLRELLGLPEKAFMRVTLRNVMAFLESCKCNASSASDTPNSTESGSNDVEPMEIGQSPSQMRKDTKCRYKVNAEFDRIKQHLKLSQKTPKPKVLNAAINKIEACDCSSRFTSTDK